MKKIRIGIAIILAILFLLSGKCQAQQETKLVVVSSNETIEVGEEIEIGIAVENLSMRNYPKLGYVETRMDFTEKR